MKKQYSVSNRRAFFLLCCILPLCAIGQVTVSIQPHFANGHEAGLWALDSTSPYWIGNPYAHEADSPGRNLGEIDIIAWTNRSCPDFILRLIKFEDLSDTSVIPAHAVITSAKLILYGIPSSIEGNYGNSYYPGSPYNSSGTNPGWIHLLADTFNYHTVTWNTQPGILHTDSVAIPASYMQWNQNDTMDVTSLVTYLVTHGNMGLLFRLQNESYYRDRMWASSTYPDSTKHPLLLVTYNISTEAQILAPSAPNDLTLFPNPNTGTFTINIPSTTNDKAFITVTDVVGKKIGEYILDANKPAEITLNVTSGVYFVQARAGDRMYNTRVVITR